MEITSLVGIIISASTTCVGFLVFCIKRFRRCRCGCVECECKGERDTPSTTPTSEQQPRQEFNSSPV
jgi:hypothetical protein